MYNNLKNGAQLPIGSYSAENLRMGINDLMCSKSSHSAEGKILSALDDIFLEINRSGNFAPNFTYVELAAELMLLDESRDETTPVNIIMLELIEKHVETPDFHLMASFCEVVASEKEAMKVFDNYPSLSKLKILPMLEEKHLGTSRIKNIINHL